MQQEILVGVIVALVSTIATYYLSRVREEKKRQEETVRRVNERRVEAVDGLRGQAYSVAEALKAWAQEISDTLQTLMMDEDAGIVPLGWREQSQLYLETFTRLEERGAEVETRMASLRGYYQARSSDLGADASKIFNTFEEEFEERYQQISDPVKRVAKLYSQAHDLVSTQGVFDRVLRLPHVLGLKMGQVREAFEMNSTEMVEGVVSALRWNYKRHIDALEAEIRELQAGI